MQSCLTPSTNLKIQFSTIKKAVANSLDLSKHKRISWYKSVTKPDQSLEYDIYITQHQKFELQSQIVFLNTMKGKGVLSQNTNQFIKA